ncbi:Nn.00g000550.m01.CDS01 [Neocucurbitaria sp. VM-36]
MAETPSSRRPPAPGDATPKAKAALRIGGGPITAPIHSWFTSPARSHPNAAQAKELPLHLIQLILTHLDDAGDLARVTRTSRLFYYMTLPRLYEKVTLCSYSEIRYIDGRPEGYGGGSPFATGLNTLVSRSFTDYVQSFRVVGDWREHDVDDYKQGRVPDTSMVLQIAMRAALDKMKNLTAFAWELNTPPLHTVYQGLINKQPGLTSLTIRCQTRRIPRPTTTIPPLPNLVTLVVFDIDPLCYPDDISLLLVGSKKLANLKLHWNPRMRGSGEESVNLMSIFSRCVAARHTLSLKRMAIYNLYTRFAGHDMGDMTDPASLSEVTVLNSMGSSDPMTVFVDDGWRVSDKHPVPSNLKMMRTDNIDKEGAIMLGKFKGLERLYIVSNRSAKGASKPSSTAATPTTPSSTTTPGMTNGTITANGTPTITEHQCRSIGGEYLAVLETNHRTMRHLLLSDRWQLSDNALFKICQSCPNLEQLGFSCLVPPLESLRQVIAMVPKLWALRMLVRPNSDFAEKMDSMEGDDMHTFAIATEFWRPEYRNLRYVGFGDRLVFKLGGVWFPPKGKDKVPVGQENSMNAKRAGPIRRVERVSRESVSHIEIWGMDSMEFDPTFP